MNLIDLPPLTKRQCIRYLPQETLEACQQREELAKEMGVLVMGGGSPCERCADFGILYIPQNFAISLSFKFCSFAKFFSHTTSCAPCAKAKAACKPFDMDRARRKAKEETARRALARKTKQQMDTEWKEQVLEKLEKVDKLVVQV